MTPQHARIAFAVFALVAGGVTYNALFHQDGTNRKFGDEPSAASTAPVRKERAEPAKRTSAVDLGDATDATSRDTVRAIQRQLKKRGFGSIPSDGVLRPVTRAAIMAFEHDNGLLTADGRGQRGSAEAPAARCSRSACGRQGRRGALAACGSRHQIGAAAS